MEDFKQELNSISPFLASWPIPAENDKIPEGYFNQLEDMIMSHVNISQHDSNLETATVAYFNQFEDEIINKSGIKTPYKALKWLSYAAAAMILGIISTVALQTTSQKTTTEIVNNTLQLEDVEILDYLIDDIEMVAEYGLLEEEDLFVIDEAYLQNINIEEYFFE